MIEWSGAMEESLKQIKQRRMQATEELVLGRVLEGSDKCRRPCCPALGSRGQQHGRDPIDRRGKEWPCRRGDMALGARRVFG
jgi:hypothetical protein